MFCIKCVYEEKACRNQIESGKSCPPELLSGKKDLVVGIYFFCPDTKNSHAAHA